MIGGAKVEDEQVLPTGKPVDAREGSLELTFLRPDAPAGTAPSTVEVEGAEFSIESRTPEKLTVRVKPPDCSRAGVQAAKVKKGRRKTVTRGKGGKKGGKPSARNNDINVTGEGSEFVLVESCRGSTVGGVKGLVVVVERRRTGKRRSVHRLRAGQHLWVPKPQ